MKMIKIQTKYNDYYTVNDKGQILSKNVVVGSDTWKFWCFARIGPWGRLSFDTNIDDVVSDPLFKNGKSKYVVCDIDHGTRRIWGNPIAHGVQRVWYL